MRRTGKDFGCFNLRNLNVSDILSTQADRRLYRYIVHMKLVFAHSLNYSFIVLALANFYLAGCSDKPLIIELHSTSSESQNSLSWDFADSTNYLFDPNKIEFVDGKAQLQQVDQTHSGEDFINGTHEGTYWDADTSNLRLLDKNHSSLDIKEILPAKVSNLVGYYRMDNSLQDSSGQGNHGTEVSGSVNFVTRSKVGSHAGEFDADYVDIGNILDSSQAFTVSGWFKATLVDTNYRRIFDSTIDHGGGRQGISCWVRDQTTYLRLACQQFKDNVSRSLVYEVLELDTLYHFAFVGDGTTATLYVNGVEVDQVLHSSGVIEGSYAIGSRDTGGAYFEGLIDELAFFNTDLSLSEIQSIYSSQAQNLNELSAGWAPKYSNLVGYWKMDGSWQDSSGNGNHASVSGAGNDATFSHTQAKIGSAAGVFDGTSDVASTANSVVDFSQGLSTSIWVKPSAGGVYKEIFRKGASATDFQISAFYTATELRYGCQFRNTTEIEVETDDEPSSLTDLWTHIVCVFDPAAQTLSIFKNGQLKKSIPTGGIVPSMTSSNYRIGGTSSWEGFLDDLAIWNTTLTPVEVKTIYNRQKQKYAGHFDSPVVDLGSGGEWTNLDVVTSLPFGKEIVSQENESTNDYSSLTGNLSNGLVAYWNFNEASENTLPAGYDYEDSSNSSNHLIVSTTFESSPGVLNNALKNQRATAGDVHDFSGVSSFSVSGWFKTTVTGAGQFFDVVVKRDSDGSGFQGWVCTLQGIVGKFSCSRAVDNGQVGAQANVIVNDGEWHHFAMTYDGATIINYIDGGSPQSISDSRPMINLGSNFTVGDSNGDLGEIDELAIWSRPLSPVEVQQLYRRGANRIKYQVRSCVDSTCECQSFNTAPLGSANDCDGDGTPNSSDNDDIYKAEFTGPGGSGVTAFSELFNRDSGDMDFACNTNTSDSDNDICVEDEVTFSSVSVASAPSFSFSDFPSSGRPSDNRYFQYRVIMEAEENTACGGEPCLPELTSVEVGPTNRYFSGIPTIVNKTSQPIDRALTSLDVTSSTGCNLSYQISNDGTNFYHWDGSRWAQGSGVLESNDLTTLNSNLSSFTEEVGLGDFYFKSYLGNSNFSECELDKVQFN